MDEFSKEDTVYLYSDDEDHKEKHDVEADGQNNFKYGNSDDGSDDGSDDAVLFDYHEDDDHVRFSDSKADNGLARMSEDIHKLI